MKFNLINEQELSVTFKINEHEYFAYYVQPIDQTIIFKANDESEFNERDAYSVIGAIAGRPAWIDWNSDIIEAFTIVDFESREVLSAVQDCLCDSMDYLGSNEMIGKALNRMC